uniref:EngB-type G domain-containing protein n=1 Tax=Aureoumbra lagunensis TaxID=44058 RepID=A0A7S3K5M5_9STRA|mmetsp:Transcript_16818/g.25305  ORF Transcript_16818/g.25305 Transcript_16818/m.25305 type:complete len:515 (+) Transcript_16818:64-1608(+)
MRIVAAIQVMYGIRMVGGILMRGGNYRKIIMSDANKARGLPSRVMNDGGRRRTRRDRWRTIDFSDAAKRKAALPRKKKLSPRVQAVLEKDEDKTGPTNEHLLIALRQADDDDSETWIEVIIELIQMNGRIDQLRPYIFKYARQVCPESITALARTLVRAEKLGFLSELADELWQDASLRVRPVRCYGPLVCALLHRNGKKSERALAVIERWYVAEALFSNTLLPQEDLPQDVRIYNSVLKQARAIGALDILFATLDIMAVAGVNGDDATFDAISTAAARSVRFVTGAVSAATLPPISMPEAVFIGRSNVGKSSLINMLTNRRSAAFTSKRPGKTQQFNFFEINGDTPENIKGLPSSEPLRSSKWRPRGRFYLVDVPGLGYAQVPEKARTDWRTFLEKYLSTRSTLSIVFHLIDSRHPPTPVDHEIFDLVSLAMTQRLEQNINPISFVIVLTKADKREARTDAEAISDLHLSISKHIPETTPIIVTSSETRFGRDAIWRYLSKAAVLSSSSISTT